MILLISGRTGSGRKTIQEELLKIHPDKFGFLSVVTTSRSQPGNLDKCRRVSLVDFITMKRQNELWDVDDHDSDNRYATRKAAIQNAVQVEKKRYLTRVVSPDKIGRFLKLNDSFENSVKVVHLLSPAEKVLRQRLKDRGETSSAIKALFVREHYWDECDHIQLPGVVRIRTMSVEETVQEILKALDIDTN